MQRHSRAWTPTVTVSSACASSWARQTTTVTIGCVGLCVGMAADLVVGDLRIQSGSGLVEAGDRVLSLSELLAAADAAAPVEELQTAELVAAE